MERETRIDEKASDEPYALLAYVEVFLNFGRVTQGLRGDIKYFRFQV